MKGVFLSCLLLLLIDNCHAAQPGSNDAERMRRIGERAGREKIAKGYASARRSAEQPYLHALASIIKWLAPLEAKADADKLLEEIQTADKDYLNLKDLEKIAAAIAAPKELDDKQKKELETRVKLARKQRAEGLLGVARTCYGAGLLGYAYDLASEVLRCDPENALCRTAMGQVKVGAEWKTKYEAAQLQQGNLYLAGLGWVPKPAVDRVKNGEWLDGAKWMSMEDANKLHASLSSPWVIETENFTLKSTSTRKRAMEIAERLESIRALVFRQYLEFFMRGSKQKSAQLLFSAAAEKKMVVNYFGSQKDFTAAIDKLEMRNSSREVTLRSAGFYSHKEHASFFYYDANFGPFLITVMQHEITHQVLGEFTQDGADSVWLVEGVAQVMEVAQPGDDGRLSLPPGLEHPDAITAARMLKKGSLPPASRLMYMAHADFHAEPGRSANYTASGALCRFFMDYKNNTLCADFLEYLHDCYRSKTVRLRDYIDMDDAAIDKAFEAWLQESAAALAAAEARNPKKKRRAEPDMEGMPEDYRE